MFCHQCGANNTDTSNFCKSCGQALMKVKQPVAAQPLQADLKEPYLEPGFSSRAEDATITELRRKNTAVKLRAGLICGLILGLLYVIFWYMSWGEMDMPALGRALVIFLFCFSVGLFLAVRDLLDREWEGVITKKKEKIEYHPNQEDDAERTVRKTHHYIFKVKTDSLLAKRIKFKEYRVYKYYRVGDRIKHHKNYRYPEKFDKNDTDTLRCIHCFKAHPKTEYYCSVCHVALMR